MTKTPTRPYLLCLCGISGSGKSTFARDFLRHTVGFEYLCPDEIRVELTGDMADQSRNKEVFEKVHERLAQYLKDGKNVLYDATFYNEYNRKGILGLARSSNHRVFVTVFYPPLQVCKDRNSKRDRVVPEWVLDKQYNGFTMPRKEEGIDGICVLTSGPEYDLILPTMNEQE